jgi:hypothetical protein
MSTLEIINHLDLGPRGTPQDIQRQRKSSFEYHETYGQPMIFKHRWTKRDLDEGRAQLCPLHDEAYGQDQGSCPYCFGTGYLGGYADGVVAYVTFTDAPESRIRVGPGGVLLFQTDPDMQAPWLPEMGTGDLLIQASFDEDMEVFDLHDRYVLGDVKKITIRGYQDKVQNVEFRVNQQSNAIRVPESDLLQDVPLVFDYDDVDFPDIPPGDDDDDNPVPPAIKTQVSRQFRVVGRLPTGSASVTRNIAVNGFGDGTVVSRGIFLVGEAPDGDVDVFFTED